MFPSVISLALALTPAHAADGFRMNDLGGEVTLPADYHSDLWSDAELKAKSDHGVIFKLWLTPFQVDVSDDALNAWSDAYVAGLEREGVSDVGVTRSELREIGGRKTAWVAMDLTVGGGKGKAFAAAFTGAGHVVHVRTVAANRSAKRALSDIESVLEQLTLDGGPLAVNDAEVVSEAGFSATLPTGWRVPLDGELESVREITAKVGEDGLGPDKCWSAIRPPATGEPDVLIACRSQFRIGPLDEHSFDGVEAEVHERWFGTAKQPVAAAERVDIGDRVGLYYAPPVATGPVRLAMAPYDGGMMVVWGLGAQLSETELDAAVRELLPTVKYTGPDGGAPVIGADRWAAYYVKHRPTSPVVLGPAVLVIGLVGGVFAMRRRKGDAFDDLD